MSLKRKGEPLAFDLRRCDDDIVFSLGRDSAPLDFLVARKGEGLKMTLTRKKEGLKVTMTRKGEPLSFRCGIVCPISQGLHLRVPKEEIWLLPENDFSDEVVVYANVTWTINF